MARPCDQPPSGGGGGAEDRFDVHRLETLDGRCDQGRSTFRAEAGEALVDGVVHAERGQRLPPGRDRRGRATREALVEAAQRSSPEPGGGTLRMTERCGLANPGGQRLAGRAFRGLSLAKRDEEREAVQAAAVKVTECRLQLDVFNLCGHSTRVRRHVSGWTTYATREGHQCRASQQPVKARGPVPGARHRGSRVSWCGWSPRKAAAARPGAQGRHLRRAWGRSQEHRLLPRDRARLRLVLTLPGAGSPIGCRPGGPCAQRGRHR